MSYSLPTTFVLFIRLYGNYDAIIGIFRAFTETLFAFNYYGSCLQIDSICRITAGFREA